MREYKRIISVVLAILVCLIAQGASAASREAGIKEVTAIEIEGGMTVEVEFTKHGFDASQIRMKFDAQDELGFSTEELKALGVKASLNEKRLPTTVSFFLPESTVPVQQEVFVAYGKGDWYHAGIERPEPDEALGEEGPQQAVMASGCLYCTAYVYQKTGISFKKCIGKAYRDAKYWYDDAIKCKFERSPSSPKDRSIIVINASSWGHVAYVSKSSKKSSNEYKLDIYQANWVPCKASHDSATYRKDTRKIKFSNTWYSVIGFIHKW